LSFFFEVNAVQISLSIHILGIVFWVGGLVCLSRVLRVYTTHENLSSSLGQGDLYAAVKALWKGFVLGGMVVVLVTGVANVVSGAGSVYFQQGWFHTKLTLVVLLFGLTVFLSQQMARLGRGEVLKRAHLGIIHGVSSAVLLAILLITYLGRFS